jgi:hypothetical protein
VVGKAMLMKPETERWLILTERPGDASGPNYAFG